jgi:hypothetical protein
MIVSDTYDQDKRRRSFEIIAGLMAKLDQRENAAPV